MCSTNEHDGLNSLVWGPDPLSSPFVPPVWKLPPSFPHTTVSPISQGPGFIKASALQPAAFCHIPDNKPEMGPLPDTQGRGGGKKTPAHTHTRHTDTRYQHTSKCTLVESGHRQRHTHTINTVYVFMCTNAYAQEFLDSRSVKAWASFVQIIIEMKAEWWNIEWRGAGG